jgi:hypothetical protein
MSPEMVERVAYQLRIRYDPAHPSMDDCARYALALAERAAREAECGHVGMAAVQRAVEWA